jgi:hypothetical protein
MARSARHPSTHGYSIDRFAVATHPPNRSAASGFDAGSYFSRLPTTDQSTFFMKASM